MTPDDYGWRADAACSGEDPEIFFPIASTGPALFEIRAAKAICRRCPVIQECLEWAVRSGQDFGVWGGTTEEERRVVARRSRTPQRLSGTV